MSRLAPALVLIALLAACSKAKDSADLPADVGQSLEPAFLTAFGHEAPADHEITRAGRSALSLALEQADSSAVARSRAGRSRGIAKL